MTITLRERLNRLKFETEALKKMELERKQPSTEPTNILPIINTAQERMADVCGIEPPPSCLHEACAINVDDSARQDGDARLPTEFMTPVEVRNKLENKPVYLDLATAEVSAEKDPFDSSPSSASASFEYLGDSPRLRNSFPAADCNAAKELFTWSVPGFVGSAMFANAGLAEDISDGTDVAGVLKDQTDMTDLCEDSSELKARSRSGLTRNFEMTLRGWDLDASSDESSDGSSPFGRTAVELKTIRRPEAVAQLAEAVKTLMTPTNKPMLPREIIIPEFEEDDEEQMYTQCTSIEERLAPVLRSPALRRHSSIEVSPFCRTPALSMRRVVSPQAPVEASLGFSPAPLPPSRPLPLQPSGRPSGLSTPVMSTGVGRVEIPPSPVESRGTKNLAGFSTTKSQEIQLSNSPTAALRDLKTKAARESENRAAKMRLMLAEVLDFNKPAGEESMTPPLADARDPVAGWLRTESWGSGVKKAPATVGKSSERKSSPSPLRTIGWGVKGNRQSMATAVSQTCLPGEVNRALREKVIEAMKAEDKVDRWVALLSDAGIFKAIYRVESGDSAVKVVEVRASPSVIKKDMVKRSFRFETSSKQFRPAVDNKAPCFDNVTDAVSISLN